MKLVVISSEADDAREHAVLRELFSAGLERYHVRKPTASREKLSAWLRAVPEEFRARLVLHQHHDLAAEFGCGGTHFRDDGSMVGRGVLAEPSRFAEATTSSSSLAASATAQPEASPYRPIFTSHSCHGLPSLRASLGHFDSIFLSPIFPSLSKPGYAPHAKFPFAAMTALLATRTPAERRTSVLALGGVTVERLPQVRAFGFDGAAVLGAIWQASDPVRAFADLQEALALPCHAA